MIVSKLNVTKYGEETGGGNGDETKEIQSIMKVVDSVPNYHILLES